MWLWCVVFKKGVHQHFQKPSKMYSEKNTKIVGAYLALFNIDAVMPIPTLDRWIKVDMTLEWE